MFVSSADTELTSMAKLLAGRFHCWKLYCDRP